MNYDEIIKAEKEKVGDLIAHWRRRLTDKDVAAIRDIVTDAVKNGIRAKCTIDIKLRRNYFGCKLLGYDAIVATVKVCKPFAAIRTAWGDVVKGMKTITIVFDKTAGLYSYDGHTERHKIQDALFAKLPVSDAMAAYDALPWDADSVAFKGRTDGEIREYRRRHFYPYEGKDHYGYAQMWDGLKVQVEHYIKNIADECGYNNFRLVKGNRRAMAA